MQKDKLEAIVLENKREQEILLDDQQNQQRLIKSLRRTELNLAAQINKKRVKQK